MSNEVEVIVLEEMSKEVVRVVWLIVRTSCEESFEIRPRQKTSEAGHVNDQQP